MHRVEFPVAAPPMLDPPEVVTPAQLLPEIRAAALAGISVFNRSGRKAARTWAAAEAERVAASGTSANAARRSAEAAEAAEQWQLLLANDTHAVLGALEAPFEDNESPAAPIDCADGTATVLVLYPGLDVIPDRKPSVTAGGAPTVVTRSKTERCALYLQAVASTVLATVREGLAAAPALAEIRVVVVRRAATADGYEPVYAGRFPVSTVAGWDWSHVNPTATLLAADDHLIKLRGQAKEMVGLDLANEPDLAAVLSAVSASMAEAPASGD